MSQNPFSYLDRLAPHTVRASIVTITGVDPANGVCTVDPDDGAPIDDVPFYGGTPVAGDVLVAWRFDNQVVILSPGTSGGGAGGGDEVLIAHEPDPSAAGLELWVDLDMPSTGGSNYAWIQVVDPVTDVRPGAQYVFWVGGDTRPLGMTPGDLWVKA